MGILCDYFAAPGDEIAASVLGIEGGPAAAPPPGYETVTVENIEPVVNMQTLEELLTERSPEEITEKPRQGKILAFEPGGHAIVAITAELDGSDRDDLVEALLDLAALARGASAPGDQLYCWLSP